MRVVANFLASRGSRFLAVLLAFGVGLWVASGVVTGKAPAVKDVRSIAKPPSQIMNLVRVRQITVQMHQGELVLYGRTEAVTNADLAAETNGRVIPKHRLQRRETSLAETIQIYGKASSGGSRSCQS